MITLDALFYFLRIAATLGLCSQGTPLEVQLSPHSIQPGARALLELSLPKGEGEQESIPPELNDHLLVDHPKLKVLSQDLRVTDDRWIWRYDLTAYSAGRFPVPPIEIRTPSDSYSSSQIDLQVESSRPDGDESLRPEFGAQGLPYSWGPLLRALASFLGALVFVYFTHRILKRRLLTRRLRPLTATASGPDPKEWLRLELTRLLHLLNAKEMTSEQGVDAFTGVLRAYYFRASGLPAPGLTTTELVLRFAFDPSVRELKGLLDACDLFKFSSLKGDADPLALGAIHQTRQVLCLN